MLTRLINFRGYKLRIFIVLISIIYGSLSQSEERLNIVVTLPEYAEIARYIGGDEVVVQTLLTGKEDPHFVEASPSFVTKLVKADLVCFSGLNLESAWLDKALEKTGKAGIQSGGDGYCELGKSVNTLEIPKGDIDRSMGDIHGSGNPHFNLSPKELISASDLMLKFLIHLRPSKKAAFEAGKRKFESHMVQILKSNQERLKPHLSNLSVIQYHKEFEYFFSVYGIKNIGSIEEKPGVPPSSKRILDIAQRMKSEKISIALGSTFAPKKHLEKIKELSGVSFAQVPTLVQTGNSNWDTIEKVQNALVDSLIHSMSAR